MAESKIFILEKRNAGLASARNHAINWLQKRFGENDQIYLTFLDADDYLDQDYFDKLKQKNSQDL
jgi:glycosyltransferase involved in cell wall biosynthesis